MEIQLQVCTLTCVTGLIGEQSTQIIKGYLCIVQEDFRDWQRQRVSQAVARSHQV